MIYAKWSESSKYMTSKRKQDIVKLLRAWNTPLDKQENISSVHQIKQTSKQKNKTVFNILARTRKMALLKSEKEIK